ncbi:hypothetical protein CWR48_04190 [Oceanobacillus arenosus]|uniref:Uncharacterized protein n=1 Tax=Oceanobacillus arenosus TaxID=1229153 RepID=A0A3D8Q0S5_9BACI|nr:hypothetical protein [Oceanobacillus arenosus]RDW21019.1 hypothetical protein CWR48_04190 [Oceanobacillus arenosus]
MSERLEEIKRGLSHDIGIGNEFPISLSFRDFKWLIQQAERVEELEKEKNELADLNQMLVDLNGVMPNEPDLYIQLKKQNQRYRQALESIRKGGPMNFPEIARKVLEGENK